MIWDAKFTVDYRLSDGDENIHSAWANSLEPTP